MADKAAYAVLSMAESLNDKAVLSGQWVGKCSLDIIKAFTNALFKTHWNLANESAL